MTTLFTVNAGSYPECDDDGEETGETGYQYEVEASEVVATIDGCPHRTYFIKAVSGMSTHGWSVPADHVGVNNVAHTHARYALSEDEARAMAILRLWDEEEDLAKKRADVRKRLQALDARSDAWLDSVLLNVRGYGSMTLRSALSEFGPKNALRLAHRHTVIHNAKWVSCSAVSWSPRS